MGQQASTLSESQPNNDCATVSKHMEFVSSFCEMQIVPCIGSYVTVRTLYERYMALGHDPGITQDLFLHILKRLGFEDQLGIRRTSSLILILDHTLRDPVDLLMF
jgi:hypothetical protein